MFERVFERLDNLDTKMSEKFEDIVEKIHQIDLKVILNTDITSRNCSEIQNNGNILEKNTLNLAEHMRRTSLLEQQISGNATGLKDVEARVVIIEESRKKRDNVTAFFKDAGVILAKLAAAVAAGIGIAYGIMQIMAYFKGTGVV